VRGRPSASGTRGWRGPSRSLIDAGATVTFGPDWPVGAPDALEGVYVAMTRETVDGKNAGGWVPDQKIAPSQR
jgi:predicted amidohydrolase YtcJ